MINIEDFASKVKAEREAAPVALPHGKPLATCNGNFRAWLEAAIAPIEPAALVNAGQRIVLDLAGPSLELLTFAEQDAYCVMKGTLPAGVSVPLHSHGDAESFYLLSGEAELLAQTKRGLEWQTLRQGDFAHVPGGRKHAWRNLYGDRAELIVATTPKLGRFLHEMGQLVKTGSRGGSLEKLQCLSERYGYWSGSFEENAEVGILLV